MECLTKSPGTVKQYTRFIPHGILISEILVQELKSKKHGSEISQPYVQYHHCESTSLLSKQHMNEDITMLPVCCGFKKYFKLKM